MSADEKEIRDLIEKWMSASKAGDMATVLSLMAADVVFMVPGQEPFGKEAFARASRGMETTRIDGKSDIQEVEVLGDWAWMRTHLEVKIIPSNGAAVIRSGYTLSILRKNGDGHWVLFRDANLLA